MTIALKTVKAMAATSSTMRGPGWPVRLRASCRTIA
jgi:hypothetical protein